MVEDQLGHGGLRVGSRQGAAPAGYGPKRTTASGGIHTRNRAAVFTQLYAGLTCAIRGRSNMLHIVNSPRALP
jgi:hypothetical protein